MVIHLLEHEGGIPRAVPDVVASRIEPAFRCQGSGCHAAAELAASWGSTPGPPPQQCRGSVGGAAWRKAALCKGYCVGLEKM
jgi:hypothetical protein